MNNEFQSPSLRGSGRFSATLDRLATPPAEVSIPFIAGQWSLPEGDSNYGPGARQVSIPFIAGQWSLLDDKRSPDESVRAFQSPSLRGSGRFKEAVRIRAQERAFQSPSLRGSGRFPLPYGRGGGTSGVVSIPFIAGQWSLRTGGAQSPRAPPRVSIPFIAGQWSLRETSQGGI